MSKDWGTYRKLFDHPTPDFERLPFWARAFAAELTRRCDRNGRIVPGTELNERLVADLAFHVRAKPGEERLIAEVISVLLAVDRLVFDDGYLTIPDFDSYLLERQPLPQSVRDAVVTRDGMVCGICVLPILSRADLHIDHVQPWSKGGSDELSNLRPTHALCNLRRGNR